MLPAPAMNPSRPQLSRYGWRPADPPRRPVLFVNPRSGDGKAARAGVAERARKGDRGVILASGQDLAALAHQAAAAGADALGMAGGGQLGIVVLDAPGDSPHSPGQAWTAPRLEVNAPAPVHDGVDGDAVDLSPPLRFAIRPAALRVRICSRDPGASPSARLHLPGCPPA
jgi:hypothetical protein